jgi:hypothetical protein
MRQTLRDFGYNLSKVPFLCDNESAIRLADNPVEHSRTKHIDIRHHFLRDHQQRGDIDIYHISTENELADIFTKLLDEKRFCRLRSELNVLDLRREISTYAIKFGDFFTHVFRPVFCSVYSPMKVQWTPKWILVY